MTQEKLRVGIIGAGLYAAIAHIPMLRETGRAEVVALARRKPDRLALMQKELNIAEGYTDWREMLDKSKLDAVVIATPHNAHVEPALAALDCGLHVLLEKPVADTIEGAQQIAEAAARSGRIVTVGVNSRGLPIWRGIRSAVQAGAIGPLRQINLVLAVDGRWLRQRVKEASWVQAWRNQSELMNVLLEDWMVTSNWRREEAQMGGDMLMDVGAHSVDLLLWIASGKPAEVVAFKPRQNNTSAAINVQAHLSNDVLLSITFTDCLSEGEQEWKFFGVERTTLIGDGGTINLDSVSAGAPVAIETWLVRNGEREPMTFDGSEIAPAQAFVNTVLDGTPNFCSAEEGVQAVMLIQSAYRSAREKVIVTL